MYLSSSIVLTLRSDKETPKKDKKFDTKKKSVPPLAIEGFAAIQPSTPKAKTSRGESGARKEHERITKHKVLSNSLLLAHTQSVTSTPSSSKLGASNSSRPNSSRGHRESREKDREDEKDASPSFPSSPPSSPKRTLSPRDKPESPAKTDRDETRKHFARARSSSNEHLSPKKTSRRDRDSDGTSEEPRRLRDSGRSGEKDGRRTKRTQSLETERLAASLSVADDQASGSSTSGSKRSPKKSADSATQGRNSKIKKFTDSSLQSKPSQSTMTLQIALASLDSFTFHDDSATLDITNMVSMLSDDYDHHDINHEEMLLSDNSIENALSSLANFSDKSPSTGGLKSSSVAVIQKRMDAKTPQKFHRNSLPSTQSDSSPDCHNVKLAVPQPQALPPSLLSAYNALCESVKRDLEEIGHSKADTFGLLAAEHASLQKQLALLEKQLQEKRESAKALEAKNHLLKEQLNDLTLLC